MESASRGGNEGYLAVLFSTELRKLVNCNSQVSWSLLASLTKPFDSEAFFSFSVLLQYQGTNLPLD